MEKTSIDFLSVAPTLKTMYYYLNGVVSKSGVPDWWCKNRANLNHRQIINTLKNIDNRKIDYLCTLKNIER